MERKTLVFAILLIGLLCCISATAQEQYPDGARGNTPIVDVWMHDTAEQGVDYLVLQFTAEHTYTLGQHVGPYQIDPVEEGAYVWNPDASLLQITVTSATNPDRVGNTYTYTQVVVTEKTLSWTDHEGDRIEYTRGILADLPAPITTVESSTWAEIKSMF